MSEPTHRQTTQTAQGRRAKTATADPLAAYRFFALEVTRARRLGPSTVRVTFTGDDLAHFASLGRDQSLSLFLPRPGQQEPLVPTRLGPGTEWWAAWRELPEDERAVMRSYTLKDHRAEQREIDIDFALHQDGGPACRWAAAATAGQRVVVLGPRVADNGAVRFRLPADADSLLMWADETALPAVESILRTLPAGLPADVWIEVPYGDDRRPLPTDADARITWLVREESAPPCLAELKRAVPRGSAPYAWLAGEAGTVKELRRHLVRERGLDRGRVTFVGYWRRGVTEEQLRAERV